MIDYNELTPTWDYSHRYTPAPRHRRRIILNILKKLNFDSCLEVGCAQPYLLLSLENFKCKLIGCDISEPVIKTNKEKYPQIDFYCADLANTESVDKLVRGGGGGYNMVICSEVIEHLEDYQTGIKSLCRLSNKNVILTVPGGKLYPSDVNVGHFRHFDRETLVTEFEKNGFEVVIARRWGFPFHTLYRSLINIVGSSRINQTFLEKDYGIIKKTFCNILYLLFFINDLFHSGNQIIMLARKKHEQ